MTRSLFALPLSLLLLPAISLARSPAIPPGPEPDLPGATIPAPPSHAMHGCIPLQPPSHLWLWLSLAAALVLVLAVLAWFLRRPLRHACQRFAHAATRALDWLLANETPSVSRVPPPENAATLAPQALTLAYLERHETACPACGYNVHRLTEPRCPECGRTLALRLVLLDPLSRAWLLFVCLAGVGAGPAVALFLVDDEYGNFSHLGPGEQFALAFFALSLPLLLALIALRKPLMRIPGLVLALFALVYAAGLVEAFVEMAKRMR